MNSTRYGDLLEEVTEGIVVQQVNAQGVMNAGFAKAIREKYPAVWNEYRKEVKPSPEIWLNGAHHMGKVISVQVQPGLWVMSIVGQQYYGRDDKRYTSYDYLDIGLRKVADFAREHDLEVHYPLIGCGLGGGDWSIVSAIINARLDKITHTLWLQS